MSFFEHLANLPYCVVKGCQSRNTTCLGKPHNCRKCGAKNLHRMADCEYAYELGQNAMCFLEMDKIPMLNGGYTTQITQNHTNRIKIHHHTNQTKPLQYMPISNDSIKADIAGAYVVKRAGSDMYLLVQQRADWLNGKLSTPGGEVNAGESVRDGAVRELYEESGLQGNLSFVKYFEKSSLKSGKTIVACLFEYNGGWSFSNGSHCGECGTFQDASFGNIIPASFGHVWINLKNLPYGYNHVNSEKFLGKIPIKTFASIRRHYGI